MNSCWCDSIQNIIAFGSTNPLQCQLTLVLLKNICEVYDDEQENFEKRIQSQIDTFIRENLEKVLDFICQILNSLDSQQLP